MTSLSKTYEYTSACLAFFPGICLLLTERGTPPGGSRLLYCGILLALGALTFLLLYLNKKNIPKIGNRRIKRIVVLCFTLFLLTTITYLICYNRQVIYSSKYDQRVFFPFWYGEDLNYMISQAGSKLNAILNYGPQAVADAINNSQPYTDITSIMLLTLNQTIFTSLSTAFGLLSFKYVKTDALIKKTIKIFLASSSELADERKEFIIFINDENKNLDSKGIFLRLEQWEDFIDAMSESRLQDEYNKAIVSCDIFICLIFTKVGKYTEEEFEKAFYNFKQTGRPIIYTYLKAIDTDISQINLAVADSKAQFENKLQSLGHFPTRYTNIYDLKYQFKKQLDKILPTF